MRVAHFSDLHILDLAGVGTTRFLNKRFTGWLNLRLERQHKHRSAYVGAIAREVTRAKVDHVVITGDLTNLALEQEFEATRRLLEGDLHLSPDQVTLVPGNHDLYTRGALRSKRFSTYFERFLESDLPDLAVDIGLGRFPVVKLRGPLAIIGLSSAVPRPPLVSSGQLGGAQIDALARILAHDEVRRRTPVIAIHHPVHNPPSWVKTVTRGLWDARGLTDVLGPVAHGMLLHGHLHVRVQRELATRAGSVVAVGATSASLDHVAGDRMAGFNLYDFDGEGALANIEAHVYDAGADAFHVAPVPKGN